MSQQLFNHKPSSPGEWQIFIDRLGLPHRITAVLRVFPILQLLRYSIVGSLAAGTQYLMVVLIVELFGLYPVYANVIGYYCGFIVSLLGHRFWTFASTTREFKVILPQFLLSSILNFSLNQSVFYTFYRHGHFHYSIALAMAIIIATTFTFLLNKFWVFRD